MSPEEMFYLATGLVDLSCWTTTDVCHSSSRTSSTQRCSSSRGHCCMKKDRVSRLEDVLSRRRRSTTTPVSPSSSLSSSSSSSSPHCSTSHSSSRWRNVALLVVLFFAFSSLHLAEGCSSRSTPKPRPPPPPPSPSPAVRPNITFQTYACPPAYATYYCLNGATCFTIKIGESILYNCECTEGYMGQRCEYKDLEGSYLPLREKIMLERASIAGGATVAVILVVILSIIFYTYVRQRRKEQRLSAVQEVSVEKLERRSRALSACGNFNGASSGVVLGVGGCRCGALAQGTVTKTFLLLENNSSSPLPFGGGRSQGNGAKLVHVDAPPYRSAADYGVRRSEPPIVHTELRREHILVTVPTANVESSKPMIAVH